MPVREITQIIAGKTMKTAERASRGPNKGQFLCHKKGTNTDPVAFSTLDDAATFLKAHPGSGIRMNPGFSRINQHIYIDGVAR